MPNTYVDYVGSGITGPYSIPFPYQEQSDIVVTLDSVPTAAWTWTTASSITFNSAVANPVAIRIARETDVSTERVTFVDTGTDRAVDRNRAMRQVLYRVAEIDELATGPTGATGAAGTNGTDGADGYFVGTEPTVTPATGDAVPIKDASDSNNPKWANLTNFALLAERQAFTAGQYVTPVALSDGATITPDFATGNVFTVTLAGNRTLANPTNIVAGQEVIIAVSQDGAGSRTLAYGSYWDFPGGTAPTLTTTPGAMDIIVGVAVTTTRILCDSKLDFS